MRKRLSSLPLWYTAEGRRTKNRRVDQVRGRTLLGILTSRGLWNSSSFANKQFFFLVTQEQLQSHSNAKERDTQAHSNMNLTYLPQ